MTNCLPFCPQVHRGNIGEPRRWMLDWRQSFTEAMGDVRYECSTQRSSSVAAVRHGSAARPACAGMQESCASRRALLLEPRTRFGGNYAPNYCASGPSQKHIACVLSTGRGRLTFCRRLRKCQWRPNIVVSNGGASARRDGRIGRGKAAPVDALAPIKGWFLREGESSGALLSWHIELLLISCRQPE